MSLDDIDLLDADAFQRQDHHEMFKRLRAESPVHFQADDLGGFWNLTLHHDVREANRNNELFSSEIGGISIYDSGERAQQGEEMSTDQRGLNMIYTDPPKHTRYRRLVNKGFTPRMVGLLEQFLEHRSTVIVDHVIDRGECDFVEDLAAELPLQAIAEIMGVPQEDRHLIFQWSNDMIGMDDPEYEGDPTEAALALYAFCRMADDAVDLVDAKAAAVASLRARLDRAYAGQPKDDPVERAFTAMIEDVEMPRTLPEALIDSAVEALKDSLAEFPAGSAHDEANRMDVCMDFPSCNVALEFSFEPSQFLDDETGTFYC